MKSIPYTFTSPHGFEITTGILEEFPDAGPMIALGFLHDGAPIGIALTPEQAATLALALKDKIYRLADHMPKEMQ